MHGELTTLVEQYPHPALPWNLPAYKQLMRQLPSVAGVLSKRQQKERQRRKREGGSGSSRGAAAWITE